VKEYQDYFFKKAKKESVLSRAYFKLQEMDSKYRLLNAGGKVLDLGSAPGSWLQYAAKRVGPSGMVVGVDKTPLKASFPSCVRATQADIFTIDPKTLLNKVGGTFDVVLSDAAPNTTGERFVDQHNSFRIAQRVVEITLAVLRPGGHLVLKVFQGPDTKELQEYCRKNFDVLKNEKPQSSRKESFEVYWVALRHRGG
jgi:23S rRNA (uridine2552-2'-O)-methyltransferase